MYQAIQTKYLGPTNYRGSRVRATCQMRKAITLIWDDGLNVDENHKRAAHALAKQLGWSGMWYGGTLPDSTQAWVRTIPWVEDSHMGQFFTITDGENQPLPKAK